MVAKSLGNEHADNAAPATRQDYKEEAISGFDAASKLPMITTDVTAHSIWNTPSSQNNRPHHLKFLLYVLVCHLDFAANRRLSSAVGYGSVGLSRSHYFIRIGMADNALLWRSLHGILNTHRMRLSSL